MEVMVEFVWENNMLWDMKLTDHHQKDRKTAMWSEQIANMNIEPKAIQGWFWSIRDTY